MVNCSVGSGAAPGPLPSDPQGQRLWEVFGRYPWATLEGTHPADQPQTVQWRTLRGYPLRPRALWAAWQDGERLVGVRFGSTTTYGLLDLDAGGGYGDAAAIAPLTAALETIGITRTVIVQSSWSGGLHLYLPLPTAVSTFNLACALAQCLQAHGFPLQAGQIEAFPNVKTYGVSRFVEYNGHRLPLQPGSGSLHLDGDLMPLGHDLGRFWQAWDHAAQGQDLALLHPALSRARETRRQRQRPMRLSQIQQWQRDLETDLAEGWTGPGQTNALLKTIACYGLVFHHHQGADLVDYIVHTAQGCPGYHRHCRHRHHLRQRAIAWARAVEHYYWPAGSRPRRESATALPNGNGLRSQDAVQRIQAAVAHLRQAHHWPATVRDRVALLVKAAHTSARTLYKHLPLWHPQHEATTEEDGTLAQGNPAAPVAPQSRSGPGPQPSTSTTQAISPANLASKSVTPLTAKDSAVPAKRQPNASPGAIADEIEVLPTLRESMKCRDLHHGASPPCLDQNISSRGVRGDDHRFPQPHQGPLKHFMDSPSLMPDPQRQIEADNAKHEPERSYSSSQPQSQSQPQSVRAEPPSPPRQKSLSPRRSSTTDTPAQKPAKPLAPHRTGPGSKKIPANNPNASPLPTDWPLPEVLDQIQTTIRQLGWNFQQVQGFIRDRFQGRQRRDLKDAELPTLLYYLKVAATQAATTG